MLNLKNLIVKRLNWVA